ncbi:MAG: hypothetical protein ACI4HI_12505 [Lachnospiraceae bacterium]
MGYNLRQGAKRRLLAVFLTVTMLAVNIVFNPGTALSNTPEKIIFEVAGYDLAEAIREAIQDGSEIEQDDLIMSDGDMEHFYQAMEGEGRIFEAYPEIKQGDERVEMRIFVRLPSDVDEDYELTGKEEIIFFYINYENHDVECFTHITRLETGEMKTEITKGVLVKSYEKVFGEEAEAEIKKIQDATSSEAVKAVSEEKTPIPERNGGSGVTEPSEGAGETENAEVSDMIDIENELTSPDADQEEPESKIEIVPDEPEREEAEEETPEMAGGSYKESEEEAEQEYSDESVVEISEESESLDEVEEEASEEPDQEDSDEEEQEIASISRHFAPVVTEKNEESMVDAEADDTVFTDSEVIIETTEEPEKQESEADVSEVKVPESSGAAEEAQLEEASAEEKAGDALSEIIPAEMEATQSGKPGETSAEAKEQQSEETSLSAEESQIQKSSEAVSESQLIEISTATESQPSASGETAAATPSEAESETPAEDGSGGEKKLEEIYVGVDGCATAKVFAASADDLKVLKDMRKDGVSYEYEDDAMVVTAILPRGCGVSAFAELRVTPVTEDSDEETYNKLVEQAYEVLRSDVPQLTFYEISFYTPKGEYIEVSEEARVSLRFKKDLQEIAGDIGILHFAEGKDEPQLLKVMEIEADEDGQLASVTFDTEGFSTFTVANGLVPTTGGDGTGGYTMCSIAIWAGAGFLFLISRKKKES